MIVKNFCYVYFLSREKFFHYYFLDKTTHEKESKQKIFGYIH